MVASGRIEWPEPRCLQRRKPRRSLAPRVDPRAPTCSRARELRTGGPALPAGRRGSRPSGTHEDREEGRLGGRGWGRAPGRLALLGVAKVKSFGRGGRRTAVV